jgi:DNA repair exonuclease SbcCD ATPase subunit
MAKAAKKHTRQTPNPMIIKSYQTTNWGPHLHAEIHPAPGAKTIALAGENDKGKSWIVRGIGFTLSIGRNEYGDKTSIHAGKKEATHKLVIEHKGQTHTIEKTVGGDEDKTTTRINGQPADTAAMEALYQSMGLPHPSAWLPIAIAMQNETDYHLRRKRSEREEALRPICHLGRIDNWKGALTEKTNSQEKELLEKKAGIEGQIKGATKEMTSLEAEKKKALEEAAALEAAAPGGLKAAAQAAQNYLINRAEAKRLALEETVRKTELENAKRTMERCKKDLEAAPGTDTKTELATLLKIEEATAEISRRKTLRLTERTKTLLQEIAATQKKLGTPTPKQETIHAAQEALQQWHAKQALAEAKRETAAKKPKSTQKAEAIKALTDLAARLRTCAKTLEELHTSLPKEAASNPEKEAARIEAELARTGAFGTGKITEAEAVTLLRRTLEHWHSPQTCPLCSQTMEELPAMSSPKARKALLEALQGEEADPEEAARHHKELTKTAAALERLLNENKQAAALLKTWDGKTQSLTKEAARLEEEARTHENDRRLEAEATEAGKELEKLTSQAHECAQKATEILNLPRETPPADILEAITNAKIARATKNNLTTELAGLKTRLAETEQELEELALQSKEPAEPAPWTQNLDEESLRHQKQEAQEALELSRKAREQREGLQKLATQATTKWEEATSALAKTHKAQASLATKTEESLPSIPEKPEATQDERAEHWQECARKATRLTDAAATSQERLERKTQEVTSLSKDLAQVEAQSAKAGAARRLIGFLDYKHAPRKLLGKICERLFEETNRQARRLEADIQVKIGKNLEFLTIQERGGKTIEQKTERLGFGKGAVLGICLRMACEKILLPEVGFLLLDEPTANVDAKRKNALRQFLQNLGNQKDGPQAILVEHDAEITSACQDIIQIGENP